MQWFLDVLFPPRADERTLRGVTRDDMLTLVAPRLVDYTRPGTVALLPFHHTLVRAALHEGKYHGSTHAFTLLAAGLAEYLHDDGDERFRKPLIIPVPLGKAREKARGFNQVHEVLRHTGLDLDINAELLVRSRETTTQVGLPRETRERNLRGAFSTTGPLDPTLLYIVVDDVVTTGATLQAAIDALKAAGATHILPIALAH